MTSDSSTIRTLSLFVRNKPGVLVRVALVFSRRGYNIESLVVSPGRQEGFSRMTITCSGNPETFDQIIKQLAKLIDVVHATDHTGEDLIVSEVALIKMRVGLDDRTHILQAIEHFKGKIEDFGTESIVIRIHGSSQKIDASINVLQSYDIIEIIRSGKLIMTRGLEDT